MDESVFYRCVEDSTEAIMISDSSGRLTYVNPAWVKIYGYSKEEAVGQTPRLLRSRYQGDDFYREMWLQISDPQKGFWRGELVNRAKDGREVPVVLTITPVKNEGVISAYMGIAIDITEKKQLEAKIFQQDRLASVGLLASGLAHEIGTPLGVIRGRAELLLKRAGEDEASARNLEIILQQIDRVSKLINNLLNLSRDRHKSVGLCAVRDVIDESVGLLQEKLREVGAEVLISAPADLRASIGHNPLEQVLINLIVNAFHSMRQACAEGRTDGHYLRISAEEDSSNLRIFVSDTGTGIAEDVQKNLFRPFFTTKDVGEGTGLGLSISAQIVSEAGGSLSLYDSRMGHGSTFLIELPKAQS